MRVKHLRCLRHPITTQSRAKAVCPSVRKRIIFRDPVSQRREDHSGVTSSTVQRKEGGNSALCSFGSVSWLKCELLRLDTQYLVGRLHLEDSPWKIKRVFWRGRFRVRSAEPISVPRYSPNLGSSNFWPRIWPKLYPASQNGDKKRHLLFRKRFRLSSLDWVAVTLRI